MLPNTTYTVVQALLENKNTSTFDKAVQKLGQFVKLDKLGDLVVLQFDPKEEELFFDETILCDGEGEVRFNLKEEYKLGRDAHVIIAIKLLNGGVHFVPTLSALVVSGAPQRRAAFF